MRTSSFRFQILSTCQAAVLIPNSSSPKLPGNSKRTFKELLKAFSLHLKFHSHVLFHIAGSPLRLEVILRPVSDQPNLPLIGFNSFFIWQQDNAAISLHSFTSVIGITRLFSLSKRCSYEILTAVSICFTGEICSPKQVVSVVPWQKIRGGCGTLFDRSLLGDSKILSSLPPHPAT